MSGKQTVDGGQVALIGFLYQMIGVWGLRALAECPHVPVENSDLEALLGVVRGSEMYHERLDTDALARQLGIDQPDTYILIQFKYSQNPQGSPVTPGDLADICKNFHRGIQQWPATQQLNIRFRLITNRPISRTLRPVMNKPKGQRIHEQFDTSLLQVLQETEILENLDFSTWTTSLKNFADEYGVEQEEFDRGIHNLIGELVDRAAHRLAPPLQKEEMVKAFRGYGKVRKLTVAAICEYTRDEWDALQGKLGLRELPIRRELFEEAQNKLKEHALAVFWGSGGSGKSVMAWHLLRTMLEGTTEMSGLATAFLPAWHVHPNTLSWVIGEWAGMPEDERNEEMEQSLRRLKIANPEVRPVLCLSLDGVDEEHETKDRQTSIREVIDWFWRKELKMRRHRAQTGSIELPDATLIVTCRECKDINNIWLGGALWHEMKDSDEGYVKISEYSPQELLEAVEQVMLPHVERFKQILVPQVRSDTIARTDVVNLAYAPVHEEILDALYQPAMWYALRELSPDEQVHLLDGEQQALNHLAEYFLFWFCEKTRKRRSNWTHDNISEVLEEVAQRANNTGIAEFSYNIWKDVGNLSYVLEGAQVYKYLYNEALSAGVIRESEPRRTWHWRHPFVGKYLARIKEEG